MNRNAKGLGFYLIVVLLILLLLTYFRGGLEASQSWNYDQLEEAITQEEVVKVEITPNQEVPTGSLKVLLSDGNVKYVNVTDMTKAESELREHESIDVEIEDVERSSVWISILPSQYFHRVIPPQSEDSVRNLHRTLIYGPTNGLKPQLRRRQSSRYSVY